MPLLWEKQQVYKAELKMVVPKECVPALIELNNRKWADTEEITGTKIRMFLPIANSQ